MAKDFESEKKIEQAIQKVENQEVEEGVGGEERKKVLRFSQGIVMPQSEKETIETIAKKIAIAQRTMAEQNKEVKTLRKRLDQDLEEIKKIQSDLAQIHAFFNDHQEAIQASMYSTSKFLIEEESKKALKELRRVAEGAEKQINAIEDRTLKSAKKITSKGKGEFIFRSAVIFLLVLIFLKLTYG